MTVRLPIWSKAIASGDANLVGFAAEIKMRSESDLSNIAKGLPEGVTLCIPLLIAGLPHIEGVLKQAAEYWNRRLQLARNRSIDLLMRVTCQKQIADAVQLSGLARTSAVVVFGLVDPAFNVEAMLNDLLFKLGGAVAQEDLLVLADDKVRYLKKVHSLPEWIRTDQIVPILLERAVLLAFSK